MPFPPTAQAASEIWRDGAGTPHNPIKQEIREWADRVEKTIPFYNVRQFGILGDGSDESADINALIDIVADEGGGEIHFPDGVYGIGSPLNAKTGVTFVGVGRQTVKIQCLSSMTDMVRPTDLTGGTNTFRFSIRNLWLDANDLADYCCHLVSCRDGYFNQVFTSGGLFGGWSINWNCYYNHWYSCTDSGATRGWTIREAGTSLTASNENHWYSCRKNVGTDGWYIQTVSAAINSIKLFACVVEGHSGRAVHAVAGTGFPITNLVIRDLRVDSTVAGSQTIEFNGAEVIRPTVENLFASGSSAITGDATDPQLIGWPYRLTGVVNLDFSSINPDRIGIETFPITEAGGVNSAKWVLSIQPAGGGALSTGIAGWSARISNTNVGEIRMHTYDAASIDLAPQDFVWVAQRVRV